MRWIAFAALLLAACATTPVKAPPTDFPTGRRAGGGDPFPERWVGFDGGVLGAADIIYARRPHYRPLTLDLYRKSGNTPEPLIVYVHGGAWVTGTPRDGGPFTNFPTVLAALAARGYVVASVEYRLDGEAKFPAAIQDVKDAIRFLRAHAADYHIDPSRVGIWGASAGGQLAALASVSCGVAALETQAPDAPSDCVQAGVSWYGVHDFATVPVPEGQTGPAPYLGCPTPQCPPETLAFASPTTYVDASDPPMLLAHGLADKLVAVSQTTEFRDALERAGVPVETLFIPDVDHGFVGPSPEQTHAANNQALQATFAFFDRTLRDLAE